MEDALVKLPRSQGYLETQLSREYKESRMKGLTLF